MRLHKLSLFAFAVCVGLAITSSADTFIRQINNSSAMEVMGQKVPARTDTVTIWMSKDKSYQTSTDGSKVLFDANQQNIYLIDSKKKTITTFSLKNGLGTEGVTNMIEEQMKAEGKTLSAEERAMMEQATSGKNGMTDLIEAQLKAEGKTLTPEQRAAMEKSMKGLGGMLGGMAEGMMAQIDMKITPTSETKTIRQWPAKKYDMTMTVMGSTSNGEIWASEKVNADYKAYFNLMYSKMASMKGFEKIMAEGAKVKGFPVYSRTSVEMMGVKSEVSTELIEIADKSAPAGTFELPKDYKMVDLTEGLMNQK